MDTPPPQSAGRGWAGSREEAISSCLPPELDGVQSETLGLMELSTDDNLVMT